MNDTLKSMTDERAIELLRFAIKRSKDSMAALTHIVARLAQQPAAAVPDNVTRTAPAKIWLQVDADDYQESRDAAFQSFNDECSWCSESQGGVEIGYIRADLCAQALASNAGMPDLTAAGGHGDWQLVPKVPTEAMVEADLALDIWATPADSWAAMLSAAPSPQEAK